jgi:hypothetical protein
VRNINLGREREHVQLHCWQGSWRGFGRGEEGELIHLSYFSEPLGLTLFLKNQADGREEHQPGEGERAT